MWREEKYETEWKYRFRYCWINTQKIATADCVEHHFLSETHLIKSQQIVKTLCPNFRYVYFVSDGFVGCEGNGYERLELYLVKNTLFLKTTLSKKTHLFKDIPSVVVFTCAQHILAAILDTPFIHIL